MDALWPWLAVAASGALHGMNPATGWALGAWAGAAGDPVRLSSLLMPVGIGHLASVALLAAAVPAGLALGLEVNPVVPQALAAGLLVWLAAHHLLGHGQRGRRLPAGPIGLALWSFIVGTAHGLGWLLVPALSSLCIGEPPVRGIGQPGALLPALAAVLLHLAAMLATTALIGAGAQRGARAALLWLARARAGSNSLQGRDTKA